MLALFLAFSVLVSGCSSGDDQAVYGGSFVFVSPGGQKAISYPVAERGTIGKLAGPDLMTDGTISAQDYAGQVVVINFWGSWCGPCRAEQDGLSLIAEQLTPDGVQFLGVNVRDTKTDGQDFHRAKDIPYPSIFDPSMRTVLALHGYPAANIPSTVVLDRRGRVAQVWLFPESVPMGEMKARVAEIAAEPVTS